MRFVHRPMAVAQDAQSRPNRQDEDVLPTILYDNFQEYDLAVPAIDCVTDLLPCSCPLVGGRRAIKRFQTLS